MQNFVELVVKVVVSQMEKIGEVDIGKNGTKTFQTKAIARQVTLDGGLDLTNKTDNQMITPTSTPPKDVNIIKSFIQQDHERYGQTQKLFSQAIAPTYTLCLCLGFNFCSKRCNSCSTCI